MADRKKNASRETVEPLDHEPWVRLADGDALSDWDHEDEVTYNQQNRQMEKVRFFIKSFDYLNDNRIIGGYHEFGCHRARTFRMALTEARRHNVERMKFFAYDSFEGLPSATSHPAHEVWRKPGALSTSLDEFLGIINKHGLYTNRIVTTKGFYQDTLNKDLRKKWLDEEDKIALVCIDCDLYESAVPVFDFIEPLLQEGAVVYIDDLFVGYRGSPAKGVARAFLEFQERSRFSFIRHLDVGWWGRSYIAYLGNGTEPPQL